MTLNDGMWRKVRGSNPQGLIQPRRFLRKPPEISFVKQCCKATCAGFQDRGESAENQGKPGFSFPQIYGIRTTTGQQPRCAVVGLRKRFYANEVEMNNNVAPNKNEQDSIEAMLKHSRKVMLQRQNKPLAKHASETLGVGIDESREAAQAGQRALAHEKPVNSDADFVCCDSVPTPNAFADKR